MKMTPAERRLRARIGAHTSWLNTENRYARVLPARLALEAEFEREADPDNKLTPPERARAAENLRKAHYARMALRSELVQEAKARSLKRTNMAHADGNPIP